MTKITPGWSDGVTPGKRVEPTPATGNPVRETPHFIPEQPLGKPRAGVDPSTKQPKQA